MARGGHGARRAAPGQDARRRRLQQGAGADAIQDELELLRRQDPSCEPFFAAHPDEPFFVKNLENVQGDERDVIFISVGYGRTAERLRRA